MELEGRGKKPGFCFKKMTVKETPELPLNVGFISKCKQWGKLLNGQNTFLNVTKI